jgi:hypothetical protein
VNFYRKFVQNRWQNGITRKSQAAGKKSRNTTILSDSGEGTSSSRGARPLPAGKNPAASYSLIKLGVTLDSQKTKAAGRTFDFFVETRSF